MEKNPAESAISAESGYSTLLRSKAPSFDQLRVEYATLWSEMVVDEHRIAEIDRILASIQSNRTRYIRVEQTTNVPWYIIATIHHLEADLNFHCHLHNGDPLTGRTTHVPAGRPVQGTPPFTWEASAIDALDYDGFTRNHDWSIERIAYMLEGFNGWGYRLNHPEVKPPYLWCFTNLYTRGKYVGDHKWSPTAVSAQCGGMVLLYRMQVLGIVNLGSDTLTLAARVSNAQNTASESSELSLIHILGVQMPSSTQIAAAKLVLEASPKQAHHPVQIALWFLSLRRDQIRRTGSGLGAQIPGNPLLIALFDEVCPGERSQPGDETPWCAAFVKWCARRSGQPLDITSSSQSIARSKILEPVTDDPGFGDLVQFVDVHNGVDTDRGHTGFYVATLSTAPEHILVLGGNQTDADGDWSIVSISTHAVHHKGTPNINRRLVGYFRDPRWTS